MTTQTNSPAHEIRDGKIRAAIWKNHSEKGDFYSVEITRTYMKPGSSPENPDFEDSHSFSGTDLLKVAILSQMAYQKIIELRGRDALDRKAAV